MTLLNTFSYETTFQNTARDGRERVSQYPPGPPGTASRHRERISYDADEVHAVLDEALVRHVGFVTDGLPEVLPFTHVRLGGMRYLHSSAGPRLAQLAGAEGLPRRRPDRRVDLIPRVVVGPAGAPGPGRLPPRMRRAEPVRT